MALTFDDLSYEDQDRYLDMQDKMPEGYEMFIYPNGTFEAIPKVQDLDVQLPTRVKFTADEFREGLKESARKLASGELKEFVLPWSTLRDQLVDPDYATKVDHAYVRITMMRVKEMQEYGRIRMKTFTDEERGHKCIRIWAEPGVKQKRVITKDDLPAVESGLRADLYRKISAVIPNVSDMKGERLEAAMVAIERYQDMVKNLLDVKGE